MSSSSCYNLQKTISKEVVAISACHYTRVAVVQLACHPAALIELRSPLEDPLFGPGKPNALPAADAVPEQFEDRLRALRTRIRAAYCDQLFLRVGAILEHCRKWDVKLVVFPEYSIPYNLLAQVAETAGDMVVVAGSHGVDRVVRKSGLYQALGIAEDVLPRAGVAVCPVLHQGRLLALQSKLNLARPEEEGGVGRGDHWQPVDLPPPVAGPMGILICLDFLYREKVGPGLERCRFLAVPSLTPYHTIPEFAAKAWEEARRYGRPVLYCDHADGGGTSLFVDEGQPGELTGFPQQVGRLERGEEGMIVADVDLGFERVGRSTRYGYQRPVRPVAAASLVYRCHPVADEYAALLEALQPLLEAEGDQAVEQAAEKLETARDVLLNAGELSGVRLRRLRRLLGTLDRVPDTEMLRRFTREVLLPGDALPLPALRAALAKAAGDVVFEWLRERRGGGLEAVEQRLREAGKAVEKPVDGSWTEVGRRALQVVVARVLELREKRGPEPAEVLVKLPEGVSLAGLKVEGEGLVLHFANRLTDFRVGSGDFEPPFSENLRRAADNLLLNED